jgi:hypothetical protein
VKYIKVLSLAAVVVTALMAFGVASASAVSACKANEATCAAGNIYPAGTEIHAVLSAGTKATLEAGPITDECTESTLKGSNTQASGSPLDVTFTTLTFGGTCTCATQNAIHLPWTGKISSSGGGNGTMTASEDGAGSPGGTVVCAGNHCTYENADATGVTITGGNPATAVANVSLSLNSSQSDFFCLFTGSATWKATYEITSPKPLFISAKP